MLHSGRPIANRFGNAQHQHRPYAGTQAKPGV